MRISDWSSDVCSSDLTPTHEQNRALTAPARPTTPLPTQFRQRPDAWPQAARPKLRTGKSRKTPSATRITFQPTPPAKSDIPCRSEEHTSELQSLMRISYAVFCLKKKTNNNTHENK